jgi:hypothetical protein
VSGGKKRGQVGTFVAVQTMMVQDRTLLSFGLLAGQTAGEARKDGVVVPPPCGRKGEGMPTFPLFGSLFGRQTVMPSTLLHLDRI